MASSFETFRLSNDLRLFYFRRRVLHEYRRRHSEGNLIKVTSVRREYESFLFFFANCFCLFRMFSDSISHKGQPLPAHPVEYNCVRSLWHECVFVLCLQFSFVDHLQSLCVMLAQLPLFLFPQGLDSSWNKLILPSWIYDWKLRQHRSDSLSRNTE